MFMEPLVSPNESTTLLSVWLTGAYVFVALDFCSSGEVILNMDWVSSHFTRLILQWFLGVVCIL